MDGQRLLNWDYIFFGDAFAWANFLETLVRIGILFTCTLIIFHFLYKRDLIDFTSIDLIVVLALGTIIGDTAFYRNIPLTHAVLAICVIVILARLITFLISHSQRFARFVNGKITLIIKNGQLQQPAMKRLNLTQDQLFSILRLRGIKHTGQIEYAFLEANGELSIIRLDSPITEGLSTVLPVLKPE